MALWEYMKTTGLSETQRGPDGPITGTEWRNSCPSPEKAVCRVLQIMTGDPAAAWLQQGGLEQPDEACGRTQAHPSVTMREGALRARLSTSRWVSRKWPKWLAASVMGHPCSDTS